jgi:hypothetical protein
VTPRRAGAALLLLCALLVGASPAAVAQPDGGGPARATAAEAPQLRVVDFTGVLRPGDDVAIRVTVRNPGPGATDGLRVLATVHRKTFSRYDFEQAVDAGAVGSLWDSFAVDVGLVPSGGIREVELGRTASELGFSRPDDRYGVYPLRLELQRDGEVLDRVTTSVVLAPASVDQPVRTAVLVGVDHAPGRLADGSFAPRLPDAVRPGGRLDLIARELDATRFPVTVATSGYLLDQLADIADGYIATDAGRRVEIGAEQRPARHADEFLVRLGSVIGRTGVEQLALPYGPADLVALVRAGLAQEAVRHVTEGAASVERLTGSRPTPGILWPPDGLDVPTLAQASGAVDTVVLPERYLAVPAGSDLTPSPVRRLRTATGSEATVIVPDPFLDQALRGRPSGEGAAVDAQRILAETAVVYFERPFAPARRGLLLAPPQDFEPQPEVLSTLLNGLAAAPWIDPVPLSQLERGVERADEPVRLRYPPASRRRELPPEYLDRVGQARGALGSLALVLPADDSTPGRYDALLLEASSVWYRYPTLQGEGGARVDTVLATADGVSSAVTVLEGPPVTLTSVDEGQIPVTLVSTAAVPLRVRVRIAPTAKFAFTDGAQADLVLPPGPEPTTISFATRTLIPGGTAPIEVVVEDPEGVRVLTAGTVVVRSTANSPVALLVTGGAGVFLLVWWVRDILRRRRARVEDTSARVAA